MNVSPINNNNTNFQGNIIISKSAKHYPRFVDKLMSLDSFKKLAEDRDVVVRVDRKLAEDEIHFWHEPVFKIKISILDEGSKFDRFMDKIGQIARQNITQNYHAEKDTLERIDDIHIRNIVK